ncbi:hypothetical protein DPMN_116361 [Dreissena polymorpha]|uniref:Uncharacterized protein n=1 Tax=Dreissena polymorpha TaxID=45954 RepID=A0A9D4KMX4_DREPO|nr:hypothetical protein DPMN_116361 [Dreissena polymorpha]
MSLKNFSKFIYQTCCSRGPFPLVPETDWENEVELSPREFRWRYPGGVRTKWNTYEKKKPKNRVYHDVPDLWKWKLNEY